MQVLLQIFLRAKESPLIAGCFLTGGLPSGYVRTDDHPDYLDIFRYLGQRVLRVEWPQTSFRVVLIFRLGTPLLARSSSIRSVTFIPELYKQAAQAWFPCLHEIV